LKEKYSYKTKSKQTLEGVQWKCLEELSNLNTLSRQGSFYLLGIFYFFYIWLSNNNEVEVAGDLRQDISGYVSKLALVKMAGHGRWAYFFTNNKGNSGVGEFILEMNNGEKGRVNAPAVFYDI